MEWHLTPSQADAWRAYWASTRNTRNQSEIAKELAKIDVGARGGGRGRKKAEAWEVDLSGFFNGKNESLARVLGHNEVANAVGRLTGHQDAGALRAVHRKVRGLASDGPHDIRLAGFEDFGPVPVDEVYFPIQAGGSGGFVEDGKLVPLHPQTLPNLVRACTPPGPSRLIMVHGPEGAGKSTMLRAVAAALARAGVEITGPELGAARVAILPEWDHLSPDRRVHTATWLAQRGRAVLLSRSSERVAPIFAGETAALQLPGVQPYTAGQYVRHLAEVIARRWGLTLDPTPLMAWLEDDPLAPRLAGCFRTLGWLARALVDRVALPTRPGEWASWLLARTVGRVATDDSEREFYAVAGERFVAGLAAYMVQRRLFGAPPEVVYRVANDLANGFGARLSMDEAGLFKPVAFAQRAGLLEMRADGSGLGFVAPALGMAAAASAWPELLPQLLVWEEAHDALQAAAERDGDPVLAAALAQPPATLVHGITGLTRLVCSAARFRDAPLFRQAFRLCATWWAHTPMNATGPNPDGWAPPSQHRILGSSPLLLLAQAGQRHSTLLGPSLDPLDPTVDLPARLRSWLDAFKVEPASAERLDAVLRFVAPAQVPEFPRLGDVRDAGTWAHGSVPAVHRNGWEVWWRTVVVPMCVGSDGDAEIAGAAKGWSPLSPCHQSSERGLQIWAGAVDRLVGRRDPRVPATLAAVIGFVFHSGGSLLHGLVADRLSGRWVRLCREIREACRECLINARPRAWWDTYDRPEGTMTLLGVVVSQVLNKDDVLAIWNVWVSQNPDEVPWRALVRSGLPDSQVVDWALAGGPGGLEDKADRHFGFGEPTLSPSHRRLALEELGRQGSVEALVRLVWDDVPHPHRHNAILKLQRLPPNVGRAARIASAPRCNYPIRDLLVRDLVPTPDEAEAWAAVQASADSVDEALGRVVQTCWGRSGPDRWGLLADSLDELERECRPRKRLAKLRGVLSFSRKHSKERQCWLRRRPANDRRKLARDVEAMRQHGAHHFGYQLRRDDVPGYVEDRHNIVRRLLSSDFWAPAFSSWTVAGIWPLAARILPRVEFDSLVRREATTAWGDDMRPMRLLSLMNGGQFDLVVQFLRDPELAPAAATALAGLNYGEHAWPRMRLDELLAGAPLRADGVIDVLLQAAIRNDPEPTLEWVLQRLKPLPKVEALNWWVKLLPAFAPTSVGKRATEAYFRAMENHQGLVVSGLAPAT